MGTTEEKKALTDIRVIRVCMFVCMFMYRMIHLLSARVPWTFVCVFVLNNMYQYYVLNYEIFYCSCISFIFIC